MSQIVLARLRTTALLGGALAATAAAAPFDCTFNASYPRQYVAYRTDHPLVVDGRLDDPAWVAVPFTERFVDISTATRPRLATYVKMRWDAQFLYVGYMLEEPQVWANISSTCHCIDPDHDQVRPGCRLHRPAVEMCLLTCMYRAARRSSKVIPCRWRHLMPRESARMRLRAPVGWIAGHLPRQRRGAVCGRRRLHALLQRV
jgi:hypothetical protein